MHDNHVLPLKTYLVVFGALLVLTGVTVGVAAIDLGPLGTPVALAVAMFKVTIVVLWFMHVKFSSRLVWIAAVGSLYWLLILFAFVIGDYMTRAGVQGWL